MLTLNDSQVQKFQSALALIGEFISSERECRSTSMLPAEDGSDEATYVGKAIAADEAVADLHALLRGGLTHFRPDALDAEVDTYVRDGARESYESDGEEVLEP